MYKPSALRKKPSASSEKNFPILGRSLPVCGGVAPQTHFEKTFRIAASILKTRTVLPYAPLLVVAFALSQSLSCQFLHNVPPHYLLVSCFAAPFLLKPYLSPVLPADLFPLQALLFSSCTLFCVPSPFTALSLRLIILLLLLVHVRFIGGTPLLLPQLPLTVDSFADGSPLIAQLLLAADSSLIKGTLIVINISRNAGATGPRGFVYATSCSLHALYISQTSGVANNSSDVLYITLFRNLPFTLVTCPAR